MARICSLLETSKHCFAGNQGDIEMKKSMLAAVGSCIICIASIGSAIWALLIVGSLWGFWGVLLALVLFPALIPLFPWYMLFAHGNWHLLAFTYGGALLGGILSCIGEDVSDENTEDVELAHDMEMGESEKQEYSAPISTPAKKIRFNANRALALYGIGTYIFSVIASTSDLEGNPVFPVAIILISGIIGFLFFVMAVIRLWKSARTVSIVYALSSICYIILSVAQEITSSSYGSPVIISCNIAMTIHFIAFVWVIVRLFKTEQTGATASHKQPPPISDYGKKTGEDPRNTCARHNRGLSYDDMCGYDRAIYEQTKAIEANPQSPGIGRNYFLRGTAYYNKGLYDQAVEDYTKAIKRDEMFLDWLTKPGHIAWGDETQRAIQLNPETEEAFRVDVIKNTHQGQRYPLDYYFRAAAYYAKGEYDRAIIDYTRTIKIDPCMAPAHFELAKVHLKVGNKDLALEHYEILKTLDKELAEDLLSLIKGRSQDTLLAYPYP